MGIKGPYKTPSGAAARHVRLQLVFELPVPRGPWTIVLRDEAFRPLQQIDAEDLGGRNSLWTRRIDDNFVFHFARKPAVGTLSVRVERYIAMAENVDGRVFYSTQTNDEAWKDLYSPEARDYPLLGLGDSVAFLEGWRGDLPVSCTAFAVAPNLVLTNWHCGEVFVRSVSGFRPLKIFYWDNDTCRATALDFSWDGDGLERAYKCEPPVIKDETLDFALLRVTRDDGPADLVPLRLRRLRSDNAADNLTVIHHPSRLAKQVSRGCAMKPIEITRDADMRDPPARFGHTCDTELGSSGSPVFDNKDGAVIGLHHSGFEIDKDTCLPNDRVNKAIHIDAVLGAIAKAAPQLYDDIARAQGWKALPTSGPAD